MNGGRELHLDTGAHVRLTGPPSPLAVVCANGGQAAEVEGTWAASLEWLVGRLAPSFPRLRFAEVRYRVKSWRRLELCVEDALAAIEQAGGERTLLVGFSMGGAVSVASAGHPTVTTVLGLAPWLPDALDLSPLRGRRLAVLHGALDKWLPSIPGVSAESSRRGFERARRLGVDGAYTLIPGAFHGIALRAPWGGVVPLPRARRWAELAAQELARFEASAETEPGPAPRRRLDGPRSARP